MRSLFPKISPYDHFMLDVGNGHQLYVEQCGNPNGIPLLFLHGGPGTGCNSEQRRYCDPELYRIILIDQRGTGRSLPAGCTDHNNTDYLVKDLELLRNHLSINQWVILGGSWGATLALLYGIAYPAAISAMILRGTFLATASEFDWLFSANGAAKFYPEYFDDFVELLDQSEIDIAKAYSKLINSRNEIVQTSALLNWSLWEQRIASFDSVNVDAKAHQDKHLSLVRSRISNHFISQRCFVDDGAILQNCHRIEHIPITVIHGRFDMICPLQSAYKLVNKLPNAQLQIVPHAGHSGFDQGIVDALIHATEAVSSFIKQDD